MFRRSVYFMGSIMLLLFLMTATLHAAPTDNILEAKGKQSAPLDTLPQWQRLIEDYAFERSMPPSGKFKAWNQFIDGLKNDSPTRQILKVNLWFNGFPYKQDNWIYGEDDHWASPSEFLQNGGDCEDYAIIKYMTLRRLGFAVETMKVAMVYDVFSGTDHAFLVVYHGGESFVLDNRDNMTVPAHYAKRYKPHFAFNEKNLWTYDSPLIVRNQRPDNSNDVMPGNR